MSFLFGPVPSRRLGRSLGIDVIPPKTCSFDCVYCESGPTTHLSVKRQDFADPFKVLAQLDAFFERFPGGADAITFSSAGEPTLYLRLGELIRAIKKRFGAIPLVVLTNGSLLWDPEVRKDLLEADRVVPSLDAATANAFALVNRPHPSLDLPRLLYGLRSFRKEYGGRLHLEVLLAEGINDDPVELAALAQTAEQLKPDRIELNTIVRPPAYKGSRGLSELQMREAAAFFPASLTEIIGCFKKPGEAPAAGSNPLLGGVKTSHECAVMPKAAAPAGQTVTDSALAGEAGLRSLAAEIIEAVSRRPCTISELAISMGVSEKTLREEAAGLENQGKLVVRVFDGKHFIQTPVS